MGSEGPFIDGATTPRGRGQNQHDIPSVPRNPITARDGTIPRGCFSSRGAALFIPRVSLAASQLSPIAGYLVGAGGVDELNAVLSGRGVFFFPPPDDDQYRQVLIYLRIVWAVIGAAGVRSGTRLTAAMVRREQIN